MGATWRVSGDGFEEREPGVVWQEGGEGRDNLVEKLVYRERIGVLGFRFFFLV